MSRTPRELLAAAGVTDFVDEDLYQPSYNCAPMSYLPVLRHGQQPHRQRAAKTHEHSQSKAQVAQEAAALQHEQQVEQIRREADDADDECIHTADADRLADEHEQEAEIDIDESDSRQEHDDTSPSKPHDKSTTFLQSVRWGLVPFYCPVEQVASTASKLINARSESISQRSTFKRLLDKQRCIVLVDAYMEWHKSSTAAKAVKQPYVILPHVQGETVNQPTLGMDEDDYKHLDRSARDRVSDGKHTSSVFANRPLLHLAALYDTWRDKSTQSSDKLYTVTILTCSPGKEMAWMHDRQPVILESPEAREKWLKCGDHVFQSVQPLLKPSSPHFLDCYKVSSTVGNVRNKGIECIAPLQIVQQKQKANGIAKFFAPAPKKETKQNVKDEQSKSKFVDRKPEHQSTSIQSDATKAEGRHVKRERDVRADASSQSNKRTKIDLTL